MINEQNFELLRCPIGEGLKIDGEVNATPHEQMQHEVDYVRAQQILTSMLEKDLITLSEFNKITDLNRKTFSPLLAEIMA
jgi:hypothetical protein